MRKVRPLDQSEFETLYNEFNKITIYSEKLLFWDKHKLGFTCTSRNYQVSPLYFKLDPLNKNDFHDDFHYQSEVISFSIKPKKADEVTTYNKWVIEHWRRHFMINYPLKFEGFEKLKSNLIQRLVHKKAYEKKDILTELYNQLSSEISNNQFDLINNIYKYFLRDDEEKIYRLIKSKNISSVMELRIIGKYWDHTKFRAYVELQKRKLNTRKKEFELTPFSQGQVEYLLNKLILNRYISKDTTFSTFNNMLKNEPSTEKILWIDQGQRNTTATNKETLLEFIDRLRNDLTQSNGQMYKFIISYFEVSPAVEITNYQIKTSNTSRNKKNHTKTERYKLIMEIVNHTKSLAS